MIPCNVPMIAYFKYSNSDNFAEYYVVAFDASGYPMIYDSTAGRLIRAKDKPGFTRIAEVGDDTAITSIMPSDGWRVKYDSGDFEVPLVGWGITRRGEVVPLTWDSDGWVDQSIASNGVLYHPAVALPNEEATNE